MPGEFDLFRDRAGGAAPARGSQRLAGPEGPGANCRRYHKRRRLGRAARFALELAVKIGLQFPLHMAGGDAAIRRLSLASPRQPTRRFDRCG